MTTKELNCCQACWAEFLSEFNFKIMYRPGKQGEKPDILTRRSQDLPKGFSDERQKHQFQTLLQADHLDEDIKKALNVLFCADEIDDDDQSSVLSDMPSEDLERLERELNEESPTGQPEEEPRNLEALLEAAYDADRLVHDIMEAKQQGARRLPAHILTAGIKLSMGDLNVQDNHLWVANRLYVPEDHALRRTILEAHHIIRTAGHPGPKGMYRNLLRSYYWPGMKQDCKQYADNCSSCHRAKSRTVLKQGLLKPLPIPQRKWLDLTMDFIQALPPCYRNGRTYRHALVVVDRLSKGCIFEPLMSLEKEEVYEAINYQVFCI
jgi:hypothetical protein